MYHGRIMKFGQGGDKLAAKAEGVRQVKGRVSFLSFFFFVFGGGRASRTGRGVGRRGRWG
jgi:hypothetical protein